jgi:hypothetical protein
MCSLPILYRNLRLQSTARGRWVRIFVLLTTASVYAGDIQTNRVWITRIGSVFIESNHVRMIDPVKIAEARKLPECQPAELDPAGNWGEVCEGFQMSSRLSKTNFTTNEPVVVTTLIRNVTDLELWFTQGPPMPPTLTVVRGQEQLPRKEDLEDLTPVERSLRAVIRSPHFCSVHPGTQRRETVRLDQMFDLSVPGEYTVSAKRRIPKLPGQEGYTEVVSGTARFRIIEGQQTDK